jgi:hypothetical protein
MMTQKTYTFIAISIYVFALVAATFVGTVYYNVPMGVFPPLFSLLALILVGLNRIVNKGKQQPPPEHTKEDKLRSSLALNAGVTAIAVFIGIIIGFDILGELEKNGRQTSIYEVSALLVGLPVIACIIYIKKRSKIIKNHSIKPEVVATNQKANTDAISSENNQQRESWF